MNQSDLIAECAQRASITKAKMKEIFDVIGAVVLESVKKGDVVTMPVLGRFSKKTTKERSCKNPRTGENMIVPAKDKMGFAASAQVKNDLQSKK